MNKQRRRDDEAKRRNEDKETVCLYTRKEKTDIRLKKKLNN